MRLRGLMRVAAILSLPLLLAGCAGPIVARLTLGDITTIASVVSTVVTGKDWTDHAMDAITGKDCNLTESILRKARKLCEPRGSEQARLDFKGVFVAFGGEDADPFQRFARARQEELAADRYATPVTVTGPLVTDNLPETDGQPRLVFIGGRIAYVMGTVDTPATPRVPLHHRPHRQDKPANPLVATIAERAILP